MKLSFSSSPPHSALLSLLYWSTVISSPVRPPAVSSALQNILQNTHQSNLYTYPTDLTRGIIPKAFHSHNDYWRDLPFYSALSVGAISVEADVWLINGSLYVGHELSALTTARTFDSLYIEPMLDTLQDENPSTPFVSSPTRNGVFDTSSGQTMYLWVDVKTVGADTWPAVLKALSPLQDAGYLTTTDGKTIKPGPITVIGTGNTPQSYFLPNDPASSTNPRYVFFDAPLAALNSSANADFTNVISPIASTQFSASFGQIVSLDQMTSNSTKMALLRSQISYAKGKGIGARYWDQPAWPIVTRNSIWKLLLDEGVALLNVDDLEAAADYWEGTGA